MPVPVPTQIDPTIANRTFDPSRSNLMDGGYTVHSTVPRDQLEMMVRSGKAIPLDPFIANNTEAGQASQDALARNQARFGGRVVLSRWVVNEDGFMERRPGVAGTFVDGEVHRRVIEEEAAK